MARIFSMVDFRSQLVPERSDFEKVIAHIRRTVEDTQEIKGALFCGSVGQGSWNRRSDIDCVVLIDHTKRREAIQKLNTLSVSAMSANIPVEFMPVDDTIASTYMHFANPAFLMHLRNMPPTAVMKRNPCDVLTPQQIVPRDDVCAYVRKKLSYFQKALSRSFQYDKEGELRFFQKAIEAPTHIARKLLWLDGVDLADDSRSAVEDRYLAVANPEERALFHKMVEQDKHYSKMLDELTKRFSYERYGWAMKYLEEEAGWDAFEFVRLAALRLS